MININLSPRVKEILLVYSKEEAERLGNQFIAPEHLLLGILREGHGKAIDLMLHFNVDLARVKMAIESKLRSNTPSLQGDISHLPLLKTTERILRLIQLEAAAFKSPFIYSQHLLLALLREQKGLIYDVMEQEKLSYNTLSAYLKDADISEIKGSSGGFGDDEDNDEPSSSGNDPQKSSGKNDGTTPVLDNFGVDLTKAAQEGRLDPVVGREKEIERLAQVLSRRKKNNPILIGEPGVGKSAIAEGLAIRIFQQKVPQVLFGKKVLTLDLGSIVAGTKYRGQFEERMKAILNELARNPNIILFIDEIHTIIGAGGAVGSLDAANMLKPALARGEIQCIGATTLDEYRKHIEKDGALERRFQKIMVEPTTVDETIEILNNIKSKYEDHHNVTYTKEAIDACVKLTERYITDRHLPDKAIDALDEAGSRVHISNIKIPNNIVDIEKEIEEFNQLKFEAVRVHNYELAASHRDKAKQASERLVEAKSQWENERLKNREIVDEEKVAEVISMMTGIPVQRVAQAEGNKLLVMQKQLAGTVIGQSDAIFKVVKSIQRNRAGLKDPNRPIGTFIFLGPTGVGKTHLAKVLAKYLFDSNDALIRIDMSEYMEKFSVSRLVGAPPGYVGYEEGGQLTEKVRRRPYSVVLLDEIEKAHPDVFNLLLQVLDEGRLTDSLGRMVDFKNTIIIMTSNIGSRELKDFGRGVGFMNSTAASDQEHSKTIIEKALKKAFAPEFINRIDDVVVFNSLEIKDLHLIIDIELKGLYARVSQLGYTLEITDRAKDFIASKGYDVQFGARPLKRAIQKYLEDEMAEVIIEAGITQGDKILVDIDEKSEKIITQIIINPMADQKMLS